MNIATFTTGQKVACHHPDGYSLGVVTTIEDNKVTAVVTYHEYKEDGSTATKTSVREFIHRESDGLFVSSESLEEVRPQWMLSTLEDSVACWKWRQQVSLKAKVSEGIRVSRILLHWAFARPVER